MALTKSLKWEDLGSIARARGTPYGGVYLIIWNGPFQRVVYVGTSSMIGGRLAQHYEAYLRGERTIWRLDPGQDVYELMTSFYIKNHLSHFQRLARDRRLWASTALDKGKPENLVAVSQEFDNDWQAYVKNRYVPNLKVWGLRLAHYEPMRAVHIESAIQSRLVRAFQLGRFFNHAKYSLLGKIELEARMPRVKVEFETLPDLDIASRLILSALDQSRIPDEVAPLIQAQLKPELDRRRTKLDQIRALRSATQKKHAKANAPWTPADLEKLRVMLVDFNLGPADMSPYLLRSASAIARRIEKNDKLTQGRWRKSIQGLF